MEIWLALLARSATAGRGWEELCREGRGGAPARGPGRTRRGTWRSGADAWGVPSGRAAAVGSAPSVGARGGFDRDTEPARDGAGIKIGVVSVGRPAGTARDRWVGRTAGRTTWGVDAAGAGRASYAPRTHRAAPCRKGRRRTREPIAISRGEVVRWEVGRLPFGRRRAFRLGAGAARRKGWARLVGGVGGRPERRRLRGTHGHRARRLLRCIRRAVRVPLARRRGSTRYAGNESRRAHSVVAAAAASRCPRVPAFRQSGEAGRRGGKVAVLLIA